MSAMVKFMSPQSLDSIDGTNVRLGLVFLAKASGLPPWLCVVACRGVRFIWVKSNYWYSCMTLVSNDTGCAPFCTCTTLVGQSMPSSH